MTAYDYKTKAEALKEDAKQFGSDASKAYHEYVPIHKRMNFWILLIGTCAVIGLIVGFVLPGI